MDLTYSVIDFVSGAPHVWVFLILFLCGIGLPLPEEVTLIAAAWVTRPGEPYTVFATAVAGILCGDLATYSIGRTFGYRLVRLPYFRRVLSEERLRKVDHFFVNYGDWTVFIARFFAGFRLACYFIAGISRLKVHVFLFMDFLGALLSVGLTFWLIRRFGEHIDQAVLYLRRVHSLILAVLALGVLAVVVWFFWRRQRRHERAASPPPSALPAPPEPPAPPGAPGNPSGSESC